MQLKILYTALENIILMPRSKLSENISIAIAFLAGIIFANGVNAAIDGQFVVAFLSILTVIVAAVMKRFVDWSAE